jgi:hypothetical protein
MRRSEEKPGKASVIGGMGQMPVHDEPSEVHVEDGAVVVSGPGGIVVRLTLKAAEETSQRLLEAAMKARGQRYFDDEDR